MVIHHPAGLMHYHQPSKEPASFRSRACREAPFTPAATTIKLRNFISLASSFLSSSFNTLSIFSFRETKKPTKIFIYLFAEPQEAMSKDEMSNELASSLRS
jgi:hypothetical protein